MADRLLIDIDTCPLSGLTIGLETCGTGDKSCPFWRGGASVGKVCTTLCNWPRNGSYTDPNPRADEPMPAVPEDILKAFEP